MQLHDLSTSARALAVGVGIGFATLAITVSALAANGDWWLPQQAERFLTGRVVVYSGEITTRVRITRARCVGVGRSATPSGGPRRWARFSCEIRGRTPDGPMQGRLLLQTSGRYTWRTFICCAP